MSTTALQKDDLVIICEIATGFVLTKYAHNGLRDVALNDSDDTRDAFVNLTIRESKLRLA